MDGTVAVLRLRGRDLLGPVGARELAVLLSADLEDAGPGEPRPS